MTDTRDTENIDEALALIKIDDEGLLAQHVLARLNRSADDRQSLRRMRGDIDYFNVIAVQNVVIIGANLRARIEFFATLFRFGAIRIAKRLHVVSGRLVRLQMLLGDSTTSDESNRR